MAADTPVRVNEDEWQCKDCKAINPIVRGICWLCGKRAS